MAGKGILKIKVLGDVSHLQKSLNGASLSFGGFAKKAFLGLLIFAVIAAFGTIAYVNLKFKHGTTLEKKIAAAGNDWWRQACYLLERNTDLFAIYSFTNFKEYSKLINAYIGPFQNAGMVIELPKIFVLSMENVIDIVDSRFGPLVRHLLF